MKLFIFKCLNKIIKINCFWKLKMEIIINFILNIIIFNIILISTALFNSI